MSHQITLPGCDDTNETNGPHVTNLTWELVKKFQNNKLEKDLFCFNPIKICKIGVIILKKMSNFRCYAEYSRGPCEVNQYLERISESEVRCADTKICDNGWMFWPPDQECFQLYTQGPCHKGDLLIMNPLTTEPYCGCDPLLLNQVMGNFHNFSTWYFELEL